MTRRCRVIIHVLVLLVACSGPTSVEGTLTTGVPVGSLPLATTVATTSTDPTATIDTTPAGPSSTVDARAHRTKSQRERRMMAVLTKETQVHLAEYETHGIDVIDIVGVTPEGDHIHLRWTAGEGVSVSDDEREIRWYSMSKTLTVAWLLSLAEEGIVALDDTVDEYLPEVPHGSEITLRMLAAHRSGIPSRYDGFDSMASWPSDIDVGADARKWIAEGDLEGEPGTIYAYSRVGYTLLAWALERASHTTWQDAMRAIATRAGQHVAIDEAGAAPDTPNHHPGEGDYHGGGYAAAGLVSDIAVVAALYHWVLTEFLSAESREAMVTAPAEMELFRYAMGVGFTCPCKRTDDMIAGRRVGHGGPYGWWEHDLQNGATLFLAATKIADESGWIPAVGRPALHQVLFAALSG